MAKDTDLINIGECTGNCNAANGDYRYLLITSSLPIFELILRFIFHQMYGNGYKIKGCTILETEPLRVYKGDYMAQFPGVIIKSCICNDIQFCE